MSKKRKQRPERKRTSPPRPQPSFPEPVIEQQQQQPPITQTSEQGSAVDYDARLLYTPQYSDYDPGVLANLDELFGFRSSAEGPSSMVGSATKQQQSRLTTESEREPQAEIEMDVDWITKDPVLVTRMMVMPEELVLQNFVEPFQAMQKTIGAPQYWIDSFPDRVASFAPLRHACLAISAAQLRSRPETKHKIHPDLPMIHQAYCLQGLQQILSSGDLTPLPELVTAGLLLAAYELVRVESREMYWVHICGVRNVMEMVGPERFREPVLNECFLSVQMTEIRRCLEEHTTTVFAQPEWIGLAESSTACSYNKFAGTKLNTLLLRLITLTATNRKLDKQARTFEAELLQERAKLFGKPQIVTNASLCAKYPRAISIKLDQSLFGDSLCYDEPGSGRYMKTITAVTFDAALLHLHLSYRKMKTEKDFERACSIVKCLQYLMADSANQTTRVVNEFIFPCFTALKYVERDPALQAWISHSVYHTGVPLWSKNGHQRPKFQTTMEEWLSGIQKSMEF